MACKREGGVHRPPCRYIAEAAPSDIRGTLTTVNNLCITFGQCVAGLVDGAFSHTPHGWRYMFGLSALPAALQYG